MRFEQASWNRACYAFVLIISFKVSYRVYHLKNPFCLKILQFSAALV